MSKWREWVGFQQGQERDEDIPYALSASDVVRVRFRDGSESMAARADRWRWVHTGETDDIVAYTVIT